MATNYLYSLILELVATSSASIPTLRGDHTHALFLNLVREIDPALATRLHDEPEYRPFTISLLNSPMSEPKSFASLQEGHTYRLRVTLLDGGPLWQHLSGHFLEKDQVIVHLDKATFQLARVLSTSGADPTGWAGYTDWQTLASFPASPVITLQFASPSAFSLGDRRFSLFPEPLLVWDSLLRTWNKYAPEVLYIEKMALREYITQHVQISDYQLSTARVAFRELAQKGFQGTCTYQIKIDQIHAPRITALAHFARYAGVGSKTTRGMGQTRPLMREVTSNAPRESSG